MVMLSVMLNLATGGWSDNRWLQVIEVYDILLYLHVRRKKGLSGLTQQLILETRRLAERRTKEGWLMVETSKPK